MKKLVLFLSLISLTVVGESDRTLVLRQIDEIEREMRVAKERITQLESLLTSLVEHQSNFAGYGVRRGANDLARVRTSLYQARADFGELAARKLYLKHSLKMGKTAREVTGENVEVVDPNPTTSPRQCPHGVVRIGNAWHCIMKKSESELEQEEENLKPAFARKPKKEEKLANCELGTFEVDGQMHCVGAEPDGPLRAKMSLDFLGTLMNDDPDSNYGEISEDVYRQLKME